MRFIYLLLLYAISCSSVLAQESNIKARVLRMYNAESDENFIIAFNDVKTISPIELSSENDTVQYLYHYCYVRGLELTKGDRKEKIEHLNKAIHIRETKIGIFNCEYMELLCSLGEEYKDSDINKAISIYETALIRGQSLYIKDKTEPAVRYWYGLCITRLAQCFEKKKYHEQVIQAYRAAYSLLKDQYDKDDPASYLPLYLLASYYSRQCKDYDNALSVMAEVMQHIKEHEGENCKRYAQCLFFLATNFDEQKRYGQAEEYYNRAINTIKRCASDYDANLENNYSNLFLMYIEQGDIDKALELRSTLIDYFKHNDRIAEYYKIVWVAGNIVPKEKVLQFSQQLYSELDNFDDNQKIDLYLQMAMTSIAEMKNQQSNSHTSTGEIADWLNKAIELSKPIYSINDVRYLRCLYGLADLNILKGDSAASLENLYSIRTGLKQIQADTTKLYGMILNRIDFLLSGTKNYKKGIENGRELHRYTLEKFGKESSEYGTVSNILGIYYMNDGNYSDAKTYLSEACAIFLKTAGKQSVAYEIALHNMGRLEMLSGNRKKAFKLLQKSKELQLQYQKFVSPKTEQYLQDLAAQ